MIFYPGGGQAWNWTVTGTRHEPGIQPADVATLLDHGATVVVLSAGMHQQLGVDPATLDLLDQRGIAWHRAETDRGGRDLQPAGRDEPVGGLFHSTC